MFQFCLGIPWGAPADTTSMKAMEDNPARGRDWAGFGIGRMQMPMVAQAMLLGGNVRVGLEDNLWLEKGVYARNGHAGRTAGQDHPALGAPAADAGRRPQEARPAAAQLSARIEGKRTWHYISNIKTVAIVGAGVIGSGWAARCLANGLDVVAWDPGAGRRAGDCAPTSPTRGRRWTRVGLKPGASLDRLKVREDRRRNALKDADFIQESAPEREDLKRKLHAADRRSAREPKAIIGSSTSGLLPTEFYRPMRAIPNAASSATPSTRSICCRWSKCSAARRRRGGGRSQRGARSMPRSACSR